MTFLFKILFYYFINFRFQKVEEYGRLVVARSNEPASKIRVQILSDFLYRKASLSELPTIDGIDLLFVPAILEDSSLDISCLPSQKDSIFLMVPFVYSLPFV